MNLQTPSVLRLDSNSLILPSANILTVNGLQNTVISPINNSQTLLVNKPIAVPTLILMQNSNVFPVCSVQQVAVSQPRSQKLIVPKQSTISTKTTFINKKPIPAVCLYKSSTSGKETTPNVTCDSLPTKSKKSKKSKGILVGYPKRKPPNKKKKPAENQKENVESTAPSITPASSEMPSEKDFATLEQFNNNEKPSSNETDTFNMENCYSMNENTFNAANDINKNYSCSENIFDTNDTQNSNEFGSKNVQFIDFFESSSTRSIENSNENVHSIDSSQYLNAPETTCDKIEKSVQNSNTIDMNFKRKENYDNHLDICTGNFPNTNINCDGLEPTRPKETELKNTNEKNVPVCANESANHEKSINSIYHHLPTSCGVPNDSLLMKYVPNGSTSSSSHSCNKNYSQPVSMETNFENSIMKDIDKGNSTEETVLSKRKPTDKEITPLSIQCNVPENKSISKELSLSLMDEKKHYDNVSSFDEFSNDLFTSLQVPASGQNADSISPTAAFLLTFPLVSSCKNADLLPEHEHEDENVNTTVTTSTTILQIGNLESPSTLLFTSSKFSNRETTKVTNDKLNFSCSKADDSYSSGFCHNTISNTLGNDLTNTENSSTSHKDKLRESCKENDISKQYMPIGRSTDGYNFNEVSFGQKNSCVGKDILPVSQNTPFYTPSCTASSFPSYNIFTKYNDIPPVSASYYSLGSQPFPVTKSAASDSITDFNSWATVPPVYNQEIDSLKDKTKRDKCTSTQPFKNKQNDFSTNISTFGLSLNDLNTSQLDRSKVEKTKKPQKQNNTRLVNWMTTPDLKNTPDTSSQSHSHPLTDNFLLQKDDAISTNSFLNSSSVPNVQNNSAFGNVSYSSTDYYLDNQNYTDNQNLNSCKVTYSSSNPTSYAWSPSKTTLPALSHLDTHNMMIPSTLPTLVGDLALGNSNTTTGPMEKIYTNYDLLPKKPSSEMDKTLKRATCHKNYCKNDRIPVNNEYVKNTPQSSFLSVTQLVDDKDRMTDDKFSSKNISKPNTKIPVTNIDQSCHFDNDLNREKCNYLRNKENYGAVLKPAENADYSKKPYTNTPVNTSCSANTSKADISSNESTLKNNPNSNIKCKSKELKYNVNRCLAKENKKETRSVVASSHQKPYDYAVQNNPTSCDTMLNKSVNPLSNKNSNYSAESLISSSNHQNSCPSQNYFSYDNTNYANCSTNDYTRKRIEPEPDPSLTNVGYYTNTNYVYPNNFQSFNNYGFSNQCYNNYSSQIQPSGLQKKNHKEDIYNKQDTDWYTPHYNSIVPTAADFGNQNKPSDKCKQSFTSNKCATVQKNSTNSNIQNSKYYQYNTSTLTNNSKSSCSFNTYSFSQTSEQCSEITCSAPNYEMKSNRNTSVVNTNNVHTATSLTNFNLSAIFPEINDKVR